MTQRAERASGGAGARLNIQSDKIMPRHRGPVSRVRNRRNVDLSAVPLPYPVLWTPVPFGWESNTLSVFFLEMSTNATIQADQAGVLDTSGWQTFPGSAVVFQGQSESGRLEVYISYEPDAVITGDGIYVQAWDERNRGTHGEWIAPTIMIVPEES